MWLEESLAAGHLIPEPEDEEPLPSGKWVQRVPRSLHRQLVKAAKREGVSLNQLVTSMLSQAASAVAWEKVAERLLCKYLPSEGNDIHGWDYRTNLIAGPAVQWSINRCPISLASLDSVEKMFPKKIKVKDAIQTNEPKAIAAR